MAFFVVVDTITNCQNKMIITIITILVLMLIQNDHYYYYNISINANTVLTILPCAAIQLSN